MDRRSGEQVKIYDGRPNTEMFLATGTLEENNLSDFLTVQANLVAADKLYMLKTQVHSSRPLPVDNRQLPPLPVPPPHPRNAVALPAWGIAGLVMLLVPLVK